MKILALALICSALSSAATDDAFTALNAANGGDLADKAHRQRGRAAKAIEDARIAQALQSVKISDEASPNEVQVRIKMIPGDLKALLAKMNGKKLRLMRAIHSIPQAKEFDLPSGFTCAPEMTVLSETEGASAHISYLSHPLSSEYERVFLHGNDLDMKFILGFSLTKGVAKIFEVRDGKMMHYRIYSSYWARIASTHMVASNDFTNEADIWEAGGRIFLKQKHRNFANGVRARAKECLFQLQ